MSWPIHEKIQRHLKERKHRKKDLAAALGIAPQTMTDICKGRSAVTLSHLRGLVRFFRLRSDYWLDESREDPSPADELDRVRNEDLRQLEALGLLGGESWRRTISRMQNFVARRREQWEQDFGAMSPEDARMLGLQELGEISLQQIQDAAMQESGDSSASSAASHAPGERNAGDVGGTTAMPADSKPR